MPAGRSIPARSASESTSRKQRFRMSLRSGEIDADVDDLGLGHGNDLRATFGFNGDVHRDRRAAHLDKASGEANNVADVDRFEELNAIERDGDKDRLRAAGHDDL